MTSSSQARFNTQTHELRHAFQYIYLHMMIVLLVDFLLTQFCSLSAHRESSFPFNSCAPLMLRGVIRMSAKIRMRSPIAYSFFVAPLYRINVGGVCVSPLLRLTLNLSDQSKLTCPLVGDEPSTGFYGRSGKSVNWKGILGHLKFTLHCNWSKTSVELNRFVYTTDM